MLTENNGNQLEQIRAIIERFTVKYVAFFVILVAIVMMYQSSSMSELAKDVKQMKIVQEKELNNVVALTDDMTLVDVPKRVVNALSHKEIVANILLNNWIVAKMELTNNLQKTVFKDTNDILNSSTKLQNLYEEYIVLHLDKDNNNIDNIDELKKQEQEAINSLAGYLEYLKSALVNNKLPFFFAIAGYDIDSYTAKGNTFEVTISIKCKMTNWDNEKWVATMGTYKITANGYFDIKTRTHRTDKTKGLNKLGLHFTKFSWVALEYN
jgi:hypothetical protein